MDDLTVRLQQAASQPNRSPVVDRPYRRAQRVRQLRTTFVAAFVIATTVTIAMQLETPDPQVRTEGQPSTTDTTVAHWPVYRDTAHHFSIPIAPGWYRTTRPLEPWLVSPGEILSLATTPLSPTGHQVACASGIPQTAVDHIGPDGVYLWIGEWRPSASVFGTTPNRRPVRFEPATWTALCPLPDGITAKEYTFTDASRDFTVHVVFGATVPAERADQLYKMLDGLQIETVTAGTSP